MSREPLVLPNRMRLNAFWARAETERPLLATGIGSFAAVQKFAVGLARLPEGELLPADVRPEDFREDYESLLERHRQAAADVPWSAFPIMPLPWAEAVAGCRIVHSAGNIWSEPVLSDYERMKAEGLRAHRGWLDKLVEFAEWLVEWSDGRCPVAISLMRGPADLLAALRGAEQSILDLVDRPDDVDLALEAVTTLWVQTAHAQLARLRPYCGGYGWNIQNLWTEEPGGWFQDDAISFWSPTLYRRHALPQEARLSRFLPRTGCHLHSGAIFTVDDLLQLPSLDVIEMNLDLVGLTIPEMLPAFRRILASRRLYVWGHFTREDLRAMRDELPTRGLALQLMAETPAEVQAMVGWTKELWPA
ncbi:MAG: hypothetical protein ACYC4L_09010 [Chloroflexota bacterium]